MPVHHTRVSVGIEGIGGVMLRRHKDYVVNPSANVEAPHPQWLRIDRTIHGARKYLSERRRAHRRGHQGVLARIGSVPRCVVVVSEDSGQVRDGDVGGS